MTAENGSTESDFSLTEKMLEKVSEFSVKEIGTPADRTLEFIGTDESQDRDGDIIKADGWKFDNYLKNPVFLPFHNGWTVPAAKCVGISKAPGSAGVSFRIKFATIDELCSNPATPSNEALLADTIYNAYKNGYMNAVSIGFIALESQENDLGENKDLPQWQRGRIFTSQEMIELSAVAIPANANALIQARGFKGWADKDRQVKMLEAIFEAANKPDEPAALDAPAVKAAMKTLLAGDSDVPEDKKEAAYQDLKKALESFGIPAPDFKAYTAAELKSMFSEEDEMDEKAVQKAISDAVSAAIGPLNEQIKALQDVQVKAGAKFSAATLTKMQEIHDHMDKALAAMKGMISDSGTTGTDPEADDGVEEPMPNVGGDDKGIDLSLIDLKEYGVSA